MKITEELYLNVREFTDKDGKKHTNYIGRICKKRVDDYAWASIEVVFGMGAKKVITEKPLKLNTSYKLDVKNGFLSFRTYMNHNDKPVNVLQACILDFEIVKETPFEEAKESVETKPAE